MKIISYYVGSQARWLVKTFPTDIKKIPYITFIKIRAWLLRLFIQEYWVDSEYLIPFIKKFNPSAKTRVVEDEIKYNTRLLKTAHNQFTVMYYYPKNEYNKSYVYWVYGMDIIERLIVMFPEFNWVKVDGTQNLTEIFPAIDVYLGPTGMMGVRG
jgi:hypothetical protein